MSLRSRYSVSPVSSSTPSPALSPASSVSLTSIKKSEKTARRHRKTRHAHKHKPLPDLPSAVTQAVTQTAPPSRYYASAPGPHSPSSQDDSLSAVTAFERFITKNNATLTVRPAGTGHALHHAILLDGRPLLQCRQGLLNRKTISMWQRHGIPRELITDSRANRNHRSPWRRSRSPQTHQDAQPTRPCLALRIDRRECALSKCIQPYL